MFCQHSEDEVLCGRDIGTEVEVVTDTVTVLRPTLGSPGNDDVGFCVEGGTTAIAVAGAAADAGVVGESGTLGGGYAVEEAPGFQ